MFRRMNPLFAVLFALILSGCATKATESFIEAPPVEPPEPKWNENTCRNTNWYDLGASQGHNGRVEVQIEEIAEECADAGVTINTADYLRGLEMQAKRYCTPHQGQLVGSQGQGYPNLCQPEIYSEFYFEWYRGAQQYCHNQSLTTLIPDTLCNEIKS